jgi:hypothetical protein
MTTRSPSGRSFVEIAVALANVHSSCDGQGRPSGVIGGGIGSGRVGPGSGMSPERSVSHLVEPA